MNQFNKLAKDYFRLKSIGIKNHFDQFIYRLIEKQPGITIPELEKMAGPSHQSEAIRTSLQMLVLIPVIKKDGDKLYILEKEKSQ
ncbi:MAG: hypothetical protein KGI08_09430 [Thaumarchaeota archaeon]|nr:hypothetical protein [Nitrososphaerota archaeon]